MMFNQCVSWVAQGGPLKRSGRHRQPAIRRTRLKPLPPIDVRLGRCPAWIAVLAILFVMAPATKAEPETRPNILLLVADNWAWPHAGACGDRSVKTPTFDRIAKRGALFTHTFCQVPSCSAARAVLLTGQASHRLEDAANLWGLFPDHLTTYPDILREHGYVTGYMVKGWGPGIYRGAKHTRLNPAGTAYKSLDAFLQKVP